MAELASGTVVKILAPGTVKTLWLKEGPTGPTGLKGDTGDTGATGAPGTTIVSVVRTAGDGSSGSTDTYTITYSDATTSTFQVYNGTDGTGTGDVTGPAGAVTDRVATFSDTTGKVIKDSGVVLGTAATKNTGTASGDIPLLGTGGLLPIARVASGIPDGTKFVRDDGTLATPAGGGGGPAAPLAFVTRTSTANAAYSITTTTAADVDAANLAIAIPTVPASGQVRIVYEGVVAGPGAANHGMMSLREGTTDIVGTGRDVVFNTADGTRLRVSWLLTGLAPGSSHTYKLAARVTAGTMSLYYGGTPANEFSGTSNVYGPITLEAYSA